MKNKKTKYEDARDCGRIRDGEPGNGEAGDASSNGKTSTKFRLLGIYFLPGEYNFLQEEGDLVIFGWAVEETSKKIIKHFTKRHPKSRPYAETNIDG